MPVSLLVDTGEKDFKQVSMENLVNDKFNMLVSLMFRINYLKFEVAHDVSSIQSQSACEGVYCGVN